MNRYIYLSMLLALILNIPIFADDSETIRLSDVHITAPGDHFSQLPERDLIERPYTESAGLELATSVVGRPEIEEMHPYSLVDAMNYIPGSWTETRGRKIKSFVSVRGQRYPYPGYLIDGAWFREFHEINYYLSTASFDRIEVLRSSSALLLGPGGLTGMVNLVPRSYDSKETEFEGSYGTHDLYSGNISHGNSSGKYNYAVSIGTYHTDGPSDRNAEENMTNFYGRFEYEIAPFLTFSWSNFYLDGDRQLMTALPPASSALLTRRESYDPMKTYVSVAKVRYNQRDKQTAEMTVSYGSKRFEGHREESSDWFEHEYEYGISAVYSNRLNQQNVLRVTGMFHRWATPTGKRFYVGNPGDIRTYSAAVADDINIGSLNLSIGYRFTQEYTKEFGGLNIEGSAGNLKSVKITDEWGDPLHALNLGASYALSDADKFFGNISWGQLASSPGMLTEDFQRPDSEDRLKLDLGYSRKINAMGNAGLSIFYTKRNNAPLVSNSTVTIDDLEYALYSSEDQENYGLELDIKTVRFKNGLQLFLNSTLMETRRTESGEWQEEQEVPEFILNGGITYIYKKFEVGFYAKHVSEYENERFLAKGAAPAELGDYNDYTGQITYHHDTNTRLYMKVKNMTGDEYSTVAGYPSDGAQFLFGVVKTFK